MSTIKLIVTTFDFNEMSTSHNNYDPNLVHPMNQKLKFISTDGTSCELFVGQIATLVAIANKFSSPGKAIDHMFAGIKQEEIHEICGKF